MKLTQNKVLLENNEPEKTSGGIFIPEKKEGTVCFKVVAVGPGRFCPATGERCPMSVKPGDRVMVNTQIAPEVIITKGGKKMKYYIVPEEEIQCILEDGEETKFISAQEKANDGY